MKQYTIDQVFMRYNTLRRKAHLKRLWNNEATSYEINIERIKVASAITLANSSSLSDNEKTMLTVMAQGKS